MDRRRRREGVESRLSWPRRLDPVRRQGSEQPEQSPEVVDGLAGSRALRGGLPPGLRRPRWRGRPRSRERHDRNGPPLAVAQQPELDLRQTPPAVAGVSVIRQRTGPAVAPDGGQIVEDRSSLAGMPFGQRLLDSRLVLEEPVLASVLWKAELGRKRRDGRLRPEAPGGGQIRSRLQNPLGDQSDCQAPRPRAPGSDRPVDAAGAQRRQDGSLEDGTDLLDRLRGKLSDVGQGVLLDLAAPAVGLADQDRGPRVAVRDGFEEHGYYLSLMKLECKTKNHKISKIHGHILQADTCLESLSRYCLKRIKHATQLQNRTEFPLN